MTSTAKLSHVLATMVKSRSIVTNKLLKKLIPCPCQNSKVKDQALKI